MTKQLKKNNFGSEKLIKQHKNYEPILFKKISPYDYCFRDIIQLSK